MSRSRALTITKDPHIVGLPCQESWIDNLLKLFPLVAHGKVRDVCSGLGKAAVGVSLVFDSDVLGLHLERC